MLLTPPGTQSPRRHREVRSCYKAQITRREIDGSDRGTLGRERGEEVDSVIP